MSALRDRVITAVRDLAPDATADRIRRAVDMALLAPEPTTPYAIVTVGIGEDADVFMRQPYGPGDWRWYQLTAVGASRCDYEWRYVCSLGTPVEWLPATAPADVLNGGTR